MSQTCDVWSWSAGPELPTHACVLAGGLDERTSSAAGQPLGSYQRRAPERTVLHELVARHAQSLIMAHLRRAKLLVAT